MLINSKSNIPELINPESFVMLYMRHATVDAMQRAKDIYDAAEASGVSFTSHLTALVEQMGGAMPLVIGVATAAVSGFLAIRLMLYIVRQIGLRWFAVYTFLLGAFLIARQVLTAY